MKIKRKKRYTKYEDLPNNGIFIVSLKIAIFFIKSFNNNI